MIAKDLGRPVKWIEDERENFLATNMERDQYWRWKSPWMPTAIIERPRKMIHDTGAYMPWGIISPYISATTLPGPYVLPTYELETRVALTNKVAVTPVRGAGRPQAVFAMERLMDRAADKLGLDRAEIRRHQPDPEGGMPYALGLIFRDGKPMTYDSGDYPKCQAEALRIADYDGFRARQETARARAAISESASRTMLKAPVWAALKGLPFALNRPGVSAFTGGGGDSGQGRWTRWPRSAPTSSASG